MKLEADNNGIVVYFINYLLSSHIADGSFDPPVYVIAAANMPADATTAIPSHVWKLVLMSCQRDMSCFVECVVLIKPFFNDIMRPLFLLLEGREKLFLVLIPVQ